MKNTKRFCALLLALIISASIGASGCQNGSEKSESSAAQQSTEQILESSDDYQVSNDSQVSKDELPDVQDEYTVTGSFKAEFVPQKGKLSDEEIENSRMVIEQRLISKGFKDNTVNYDTKDGTMKVSANRVFISEDYDTDEFKGMVNELVLSLSQTSDLTVRVGTSKDGDVVIDNKHIKKTYADRVTYGDINDYAVILELTEEGKKIFAEATGKYLGQQFSIWVNDKCISSPTVNSVVEDGKVSITGSFTEASANVLAAEIGVNDYIQYSLKENSLEISAPDYLEAENAVGKIPWSIKSGDQKLSVTFRNYYLYETIHEAYSNITSQPDKQDLKFKDIDFSKETIEDKPALQWINDNADKKTIEFLYLKTAMRELSKYDTTINTDLPEDDEFEPYKQYYGEYQNYYGDFYDYFQNNYDNIFSKLLISKTSYIGLSIYPGLYKSRIFELLYGKGGKLEVKVDEFKKFYTENYYPFCYFQTDLTTVDEEGNSVSIDDQTKALYMQRYQKYADMMNNEGKTIEDVISQYKSDFDTDTDPSSSGSSYRTDLYESAFADHIFGMKDNTAVVYEIGGKLYFLYKYDTQKKAEQLSEDSEEIDYLKESMLSKMKDEEFEKYLEEEINSFQYEKNSDLPERFSAEKAIKIIRDSDFL